MATFWLETSVEGYFWWKPPVGRQLKSLEEYSPLWCHHLQTLISGFNYPVKQWPQLLTIVCSESPMVTSNHPVFLLSDSDSSYGDKRQLVCFPPWNPPTS